MRNVILLQATVKSIGSSRFFTCGCRLEGGGAGGNPEDKEWMVGVELVGSFSSVRASDGSSFVVDIGNIELVAQGKGGDISSNQVFLSPSSAGVPRAETLSM